jgi:hypothetical protein
VDWLVAAKPCAGPIRTAWQNATLALILVVSSFADAQHSENAFAGPQCSSITIAWETAASVTITK